MCSSDSWGKAVLLPHSGGKLPDKPESGASTVTHRLCKAGKAPWPPHSGGKLPDKRLTPLCLASPRYSSAKEGNEVFLPQEAGRVPVRGSSTRDRERRKGNASEAPQLLGKVPVIKILRKA